MNGALENLMRLRSMPAIDELIVENNKMPTLPARAFGALQVFRVILISTIGKQLSKLNRSDWTPPPPQQRFRVPLAQCIRRVGGFPGRDLYG